MTEPRATNHEVENENLKPAGDGEALYQAALIDERSRGRASGVAGGSARFR